MKNFIFIFVLSAVVPALANAQEENGVIRKGNKLYKEKQYDQSLVEYNKAVTIAPSNAVANYNQGNAQVKTNQLEEAVTSYDATINNASKPPVREKGYYNKGVAFIKQQKLQESIDAWKNALKIDPNDQEARENLQKALMEQKKQQQKEKENENNKNKKDQKQDKNQDKEQPQDPKQQSKLTKKQVEQLLKALQQKEKEVNQKLQSRNSSPSQQDKDW